MAEEEKGPEEEVLEQAEEKTIGRVDGAYEKIMGYISSKVSSFVAFLFFLFTVGAFFGMVAATHFSHLAIYFVIAPAILGLIAYYNRSFATLMFFLLIIMVFLI